MSNGQGNSPGGSGGNTPPPANPAPDAVLQALKDINDALKQQYDLSVKINEQARQESNSLRAQKIALKERLSALNDESRSLLEIEGIVGKIASTEQRRYEALLTAQKIDETNVEITKNKIKAKTEEIELLKASGKLTEAAQEEKKLKELTALYFKMQTTLKSNNEARSVEINYLEQNLRINRQQEAVLTSITLKLREQIGSLLGMPDLLNNILNGWNPILAISYELVSQAIKMTSVLAQANATYAATTGRVAENFQNFGSGMSQFGIGFKEMAEANLALYQSMTGFTEQTVEVRKELTESAAKMKNLGVEVTTTGKNFDILTKTLRMSSNEAMVAQDRIAKHAIAAGIAPKQMLQEFATNMPKLAGYGQQAIDVFIKLEKQAKSLGMSVQELNGIVGDQFDTFDGAATAAGKLNAILGGNYLNSIEMMNATESERILIMKKAIDAAGLQADGMNKFQLIAFANAAGIKDLNAAKNLLSKNTTQLTMDMEKEAASQKELQAAQEAAALASQKMQTALQSVMVIAQPLLYIINSFAKSVSFIADAMDKVHPSIKPVVSVLLLLVIAKQKAALAANLLGKAWTNMSTGGKIGAIITLLAILVPMLIDLSNAITKPRSPPLYLAVPMLSKAFDVFGEVIEKRMGTFIQIGLVVLALALAVKLAASGLAELVKAFAGLTGPQALAAFGAIVVVMAGFIVALVILTKVSTVAAIPILAVGAGIALIGAGIFMAATGMAKLIDSIKSLASGLTGEAVANLYGVATAIGVLVAAFAGAGFGAIGMAIGAFALAGSLIIISKALGDLNETKITAFNTLIKNFADTLKLSGIEAISEQIAKAINNISEAINKMPEGKTVNFATTMDSINRTFSSIAQSDPAKIDSAKQFVETAKDYYTVQKDSKNADNDALVAAITKALNNVAAGATTKETKGGAAGNATVTLQIDGQEMGKVLLPYLDSKLASKYKGSF